MTTPEDSGPAPALYGQGKNGTWQSIHRYQGGDYGLEDIPRMFGLGRRLDRDPDGPVVVELEGWEIRELRALADSHSFDLEVGFYELCLDLVAWSAGQRGARFRLAADF